MRRGIIALALVGALLAPTSPAGGAADAPNLEAYRGLGAWVDMFEARAWRRPAAAVADMAAHGVRTLFLETSNYSRDRAMVRRDAVARFIEAAHARGLRVVAWYLPGFDDLARDLRRSMAAIKFRSPAGERFDSFALDIEASIVAPPATRSRRLVALSRRIRARVGRAYPLGAIIPSPYRMDRGKTWPRFPYSRLARLYDVFLPMSYYTFHVEGERRAHDEVAASIPLIRQETGDPSVPIHVIGGIADDSSGRETRGFVRAAREHGALGASLYNWSLTREHDWAELAAVPVNPVQAPPLPLTLPWAAPIGNVPGSDESHPHEVFFQVGGITGARTLHLEGVDISPGEVTILVNWVPVAELASGTGWGAAQAVPVADARLRDARPNVIGFVATGGGEWGIRNVALA